MDKKLQSIGIIGMGWVGSSVAISILHQGICRSLLLNDTKEGLAEGEAMDLNHGASFYPSTEITQASISDMMDCDAIVITAGRGGKPGETRLDLLKENIGIAREISNQLTSFKGILLIVSNPVDVLTYFYQQFTGLPSTKVLGTGTMLDTARLRYAIGEKVNLDSKAIHAQVIGEHGDSEVVVWSSAVAGGRPIQEWPEWNPSFESELSDQVRNAAYEIIKRKGATNHAIGLVTATILKFIMRGERRILTLSSCIHGSYGINDVALSLPSVISSTGIEEVIEIPLTKEERNKLLHSASVLKEAINSV